MWNYSFLFLRLDSLFRAQEFIPFPQYLQKSLQTLLQTFWRSWRRLAGANPIVGDFNALMFPLILTTSGIFVSVVPISARSTSCFYLFRNWTSAECACSLVLLNERVCNTHWMHVHFSLGECACTISSYCSMYKKRNVPLHWFTLLHNTMQYLVFPLHRELRESISLESTSRILFSWNLGDI